MARLWRGHYSTMIDVGDLPVLTFANCVLKTGVINYGL